MNTSNNSNTNETITNPSQGINTMKNSINNATDLQVESTMNTQGNLPQGYNVMNTTQDFGGSDMFAFLSDTGAGDSFDLSDIMSADLFTEDGALTSSSKEHIALERAMAKIRHEGQVIRNIEKCIAFTRTINLIKDMGEFNELRKYLVYAALSYTRYWHFNAKNEKITVATKLFNDFLRIVDKDSKPARQFDEAYEWLTSQYTLNELDAQKNSNLMLITEPATDIKVSILRSGIGITAEAGAQIVTTNSNKPFIFKRKTSAIFGIEVFNKYLGSVLKSVNIHNEFTVDEGKSFNKVYTEYRKDSLKFRRADVLGLLLLLKTSNIDIRELFKSHAEGTNKGLALTRKLDGSIARITVPAHTFSAVYGKTGVVSLSEARQGYFSPMVSVPRLIEFHEEEGKVVTREAVNKTINRADKLQDKDGWVTPSVQMIVVVNATQGLSLNRALLTGAIFMPTSWLLKWGCNRVITEMDIGGIKSATAPVSDLDARLDHIDTGIVSPASFKGGIISALSLAEGNPDLIKNLSALVGTSSGSDLAIRKICMLLQKHLKKFIIDGEEVQGFVINVPLTITNAYTVESVMLNPDFEGEEEDNVYLANEDLKKNLDNLESELETGKRSINGFRDRIMDRAINDPDFFIGHWINDGLESGELIYKPAVTRVIAPEIQTIAHHYGKKEALDYLKGLLSYQAEGMDSNKVYAAQWLTANTNISRTVRIEVLAEKLINSIQEYNFDFKDNSPVYPTEVIKEIHEAYFKTELLNDWVGVVFPNGEEVPMPLGSIFENDLVSTFEKPSRFTVVKGLFKELLEVVKSNIVDNKFQASTVSAKLLAAEVQKPLLGKNFGYQYARGTYGVMLPLLETMDQSRIGLTNRNRLSYSKSEYVKMNGSKAPQLFYGASAGYRVIKKTIRNELLNAVFSCAIFITPEATMILQNDHDGDLFRLTADEHVLPMFKGPYTQFNSKFFTDFLSEEFKNNYLKIGKAVEVDISVFHEEIYNAVEAKGKVGQYTANKYFYEVAFENMTSFEGTDGGTYEINAYDKHVVTAILAQLIQEEAMNNIKQQGSSAFFTDLVLYWKLNNLKAYGTLSTEQVIEARLKACMDLLELLNTKYEMKLTHTRIKTYVEALFFAANNFNRENLLAFSMMNKRCIEDRNITDIMSTVTVEDYEYKGTFDFYGSYDAIMNSADTNSMYYHIVKETITTVFGPGEGEV